MNKKELREELKKQVKDKTISKWFWVIFFILGLLLCFTIILAIIGIPMVILASICGALSERRLNILNLELKKL